MQLLRLKRKSDARGDSLIPPWHPNLRIAGRLPDIKVVRTAFFVNGAAIALAAGLALYLGFQEWKIREINTQISDLTRQIDRDRPRSEAAVRLYGQFKEQEAMAKEVKAFVGSKPSALGLVLHIGKTLPNKIALDSIQIQDSGMDLHATVRGAPDQASGDVSAYLDQLHRDPEMSAQFGDITLTGLSRNADSGRLMIEIFLKNQGAAAK